MATGLTLLDDEVRVGIWGALPEGDEALEEQLEALEFADVAVQRLDGQGSEDCQTLAGEISESDRVFWL